MRVLLIALLVAISYAQTETYIAQTHPPEGGYCDKLVSKFNGECRDTDNSFTLFNDDGLTGYGGMNRGMTFAKNICILALYKSTDKTLSKYGDLVTASWNIGGPEHLAMEGNILTDAFIPGFHECLVNCLPDAMVAPKAFMYEGSRSMQSFTELTCTFKPRDYDLSNIAWSYCGDVGGTDTECTCFGGYTRLERTDNQYYYPLNKGPGFTRDTLKTECKDSSFAVNDGMGKTCECGYSTECEDVSQIYPFNCGDNDLDTLSEEWNFILDCPRDVDSLDIQIFYQFFPDRPDVYIDGKKIITWDSDLIMSDLGPVSAGEHELSVESSTYEFSLRTIKLHDSDCLLSWDSDKNLVEQVIEHANNFIDKLKDGDLLSIGIVAAAVLVPLLCCCICCCCQMEKNRRVVYSLR